MDKFYVEDSESINLFNNRYDLLRVAFAYEEALVSKFISVDNDPAYGYISVQVCCGAEIEWPFKKVDYYNDIVGGFLDCRESQYEKFWSFFADAWYYDTVTGSARKIANVYKGEPVFHRIHKLSFYLCKNKVVSPLLFWLSKDNLFEVEASMRELHSGDPFNRISRLIAILPGVDAVVSWVTATPAFFVVASSNPSKFIEKLEGFILGRGVVLK